MRLVGLGGLGISVVGFYGGFGSERFFGRILKVGKVVMEEKIIFFCRKR